MMLNDLHDHLDEIEQQFEKQIDDWRSNRAGGLRSLYAPPGGGKTWLLQRWVRKWPGAFFDLSENAGTSAEYVHRARERLAQMPGSFIFYLDNVPREVDEHIQAFQEEILQPALNRGSLVIQCQIHPNRTCWGGAIPHPHPISIPGLTQAGIVVIRKKYGYAGPLSEVENLLFAGNETLPGLVTAWCQGLKDAKTGKTILRDYLYTWWNRFEGQVTNSFSKQLYPYAMLACRSLVDINELLHLLTEEQKQNLESEGVSFAERGLKLTLKLKRLQWVQTDNSWYPPVAAVLKTWLLLRKPDLYQALTSSL